MKANLVFFVIACSFILAVMGCNQDSNESKNITAGWTRTTVDSLDEQAKSQLAVALRAKQALESTLKSNLLASIKTDGPHGAVNTCSTIAPELASSVSEEFGLRIGRTSAKLRNPSNVAPGWMETVVSQQLTESAYFQNPDRSLAVSYPITIAAPCLLCHGENSNVSQEVRTAIQDQYPTDQALGYQLGDLRGWFWVEVP